MVNMKTGSKLSLLIRHSFLCLFVLLSLQGFGQATYLDTLQNKLKTEKRDTVRVKLLTSLVDELAFIGNYEEAMKAGKKALVLSTKINWHRGIIYSLIAVGNVYEFSGKTQKAVAKYIEAEKKVKAWGLTNLLGSCYSNLGSLYYQSGDIIKSQQYFQKMLVTELKHGDEDGIARAYNNLGATYQTENEYEKSIHAYNEAIKIYKKQKNTRNLADAYNNIGNVYQAMNDFASSIDHFRQALRGYTKTGDRQGYSIAAGNIANGFTHISTSRAAVMETVLKTGKDSMFNRQLSIDSSVFYANAALKINQEFKDLYNMAHALKSLGYAYINMGKYNKAIDILKESMKNAEEINALSIQKAVSEALANSYAKIGSYKPAYEWSRKEIVLRDSIFSQEKQVEAGRQQGRFETEKQLALDAMKHEKNIAAEKKQQWLIIIFSCIVIAVVIIFLIISFNRLKITRKQKRIIELQKHEVSAQKELVEEKNKEITDSINYAKRIQLGILPSDEELKNALGDHFVLYLPKDIVSGDFYWAISTTTSNTGIKLSVFAAVDCTGHGVPGAIMSMLGKTLLNQTVKNPDINTPADVLDFLNKELPKNLKSHEANTDIKDGMDISLCALNVNARKLYFSGANNPCIIARKGELTEIGPDKQAVSASDVIAKKPFNNKIFDLLEGDMVYLFTDGYADQFGGVKGKKFKYNQFKEVLSKIAGEPTHVQREKLKTAFEEWKGNFEQTDDVCVMGVRV
jgi:tetratricopeptide (TPR) repeat protein